MISAAARRSPRDRKPAAAFIVLFNSLVVLASCTGLLLYFITVKSVKSLNATQFQQLTSLVVGSFLVVFLTALLGIVSVRRRNVGLLSLYRFICVVFFVSTLGASIYKVSCGTDAFVATIWSTQSVLVYAGCAIFDSCTPVSSTCPALIAHASALDAIIVSGLVITTLLNVLVESVLRWLQVSPRGSDGGRTLSGSSAYVSDSSPLLGYAPGVAYGAPGQLRPITPPVTPRGGSAMGGSGGGVAVPESWQGSLSHGSYPGLVAVGPTASGYGYVSSMASPPRVSSFSSSFGGGGGGVGGVGGGGGGFGGSRMTGTSPVAGSGSGSLGGGLTPPRGGGGPIRSLPPSAYYGVVSTPFTPASPVSNINSSTSGDASILSATNKNSNDNGSGSGGPLVAADLVNREEDDDGSGSPPPYTALL